MQHVENDTFDDNEKDIQIVLGLFEGPVSRFLQSADDQVFDGGYKALFLESSYRDMWTLEALLHRCRSVLLLMDSIARIC